jgi:hypothetical protein
MNACVLFLIGLTTLQAFDSPIRRFGPVGGSLSAVELAQISDLARREGRAPWLILGFRSIIPGEVRLDAYLEPDQKTERVHRGRILRLIADDPPRVAERSRWKLETTAAYAYLVRPGEIADEHDVRWPFAVVGEIDDETLISLVTFVRSGPAIPGVPDGHGPGTELVSAPLSTVMAGQGGEFIVALRTGDAAVLRLTVVRHGGRWQVSRWDAAVA